MFAIGVASALLGATSATSFYETPSKIFNPTLIDGHKSFVSSIEKSTMKWVLFPEQKQLHSDVISGKSNFASNLILSSDNSFWTKVKSQIGLNNDCEMVLLKEWTVSASHTTYRKYSQMIKGVRVFGGEFVVVSGAHGGVLHVHGQPLLLEDSSELKWDALLSANFDLKTTLEPINQHLLKFYEGDIGGINLIKPVERVIHNSLMVAAKQGLSKLAYYVNGQVRINHNTMLSFDAFVDIETGELLEFLDKSTEVSPFKSPIPDPVYVYDQYLKDFNDDYIYDDDYTHVDPDRYSNYTLVFNSSVDSYPTTDWELNELVDNTLYIKYMYYSLSNGQYVSWNETETDWNIEYNLTIANAYFDGTWGIHFGSGYITDDVVPHEWSHGYTQTGCGLIYAMESGAMNEAFSDIFGESIDILNHDTPDPDQHRTVWPTSCHQTLNNNAGIPPGNDPGTRWSMGENVTTTYPNHDGSIRDMYKPECFFHPSTTLADYYSCTTYADGGGVHKNSGVLNRLYAVLVDGGEYADPASTTGATLSVYSLGWVKAINLIWRTHQELTPTSQYMDFANALSAQCELNIGTDLYVPNVFNTTITVSSEKLTQADCDNVAVALLGSGMNDDSDFCPNVNCVNKYGCIWANCATDATAQIFYEDYDYYMGYNGNYTIQPSCSGTTNTYARVFDQTTFPDLDGMLLSCIQFGYFMQGQTTVNIKVYIDSTGGAPDTASMTLLQTFEVTTINAVGQMQVQTVSAQTPVKVDFQSLTETLVVVMETPVMSEGYIKGGGQLNIGLKGTTGATYVGDCTGGFISYAEYVDNTPTIKRYNENAQWYIRLHGTAVSKSPTSSPTQGSKKKDSEDDDSSLSSGAIAGISIGVIVGVIAVGAIAYFVFVKKGKGSASTPLITDPKI